MPSGQMSCTIGAVFDFCAGRVKHARPDWAVIFRKASLFLKKRK